MKPLTTERRAEIEAKLAAITDERTVESGLNMYIAYESTALFMSFDDLRDLLADSAYWRAQVKNAHPGGCCSFCGRVDNGTGHEPDCAYDLAQERQ